MATAAICAVMVLARPASAQSPTGGNVVAGTAGIAQAGAVTNINQASQKAIINWQGFSVGAQNTVNFNQPNSSAATLNRVIGNERSVIDGAINANGQVFIVNSNGVLFGKGSQVNVGGLVASTLDISNNDFMAGNYKFSGTSNASVVNQGRIRAHSGGYVALLGKTVSNEGIISARLGTVAMAAGEQITLNFGGDSLIDVTIDKGTLNALVSNKRAIIANGGQVIMTAKAADQVLSAQVNNTGIIQARTMAALKGGSNSGKVHIGKIKLRAQGGTTSVSGKLDASAPKGGNGGSISVASTGGATTISGTLTTAAEKGIGGTVVVTGSTVGLTTTAAIDASGMTGGTILVGGDRLGGSDASQKFLSMPVANATVTTIAQGATLTANGSNGNGGNVVVWSDEHTDYAGGIFATGAGSSGNGGFAEVSSHGLLGFTGAVDLSSAQGAAGTLLLDPYNVTISADADSNGGFDSGSPTNTYSPTDTSVINATTLLNALANADVVITTGVGGAGAGVITVRSALDWSSVSATPSTHSLTLSGAGGIFVNAPLTWSGSSALTLLSANGFITTSSAGTLNHTGNGGSLTLTAYNNITIGLAVTLGNASLTVMSTIGNIAINRALSWAGTAVSLQTAAGNISTGGAGTLTQTGNGGSLSLTTLGVAGGNGAGDITLNGAVDLGNASLTAKVNSPTSIISTVGNLSWSGTAVKLTASGGNITTRGLSPTDNGSLVIETTGAGAIALAAFGTTVALDHASLTASTTAGAITIDGPITWSGSQVKFTTVDGSITTSAAGTLTQTGNGSLVLGSTGTGAIGLAGQLVLNNGSLTAGTTTGGIAINAPVTWSGSQVKFTTTGGSITTAAAATLTQTGNGNLTLNPGTGTLTLNGAVSLDSATSSLTGMDVIVNAPISWASGQTLTLTAARNLTINTPLSWSGGMLALSAANNIYVNGDLTGTGSTVGLTATFGTGVNADGSAMGLHMGLAVGGLHTISLPSTAAVSLNGATYSVITSKAQFDAVSGNLSGRYVLGSDIAGLSLSDFQPFGLASTNQFRGGFHGLGHSLTLVPGILAISSSLALSGLNGAAIVLPFNGTLNVGGSVAFSSAGGMVVVTTPGDINVTSPLTVSAPGFSLSAGGDLNVATSSFTLSNGTTLGLSAAGDVNINNALSWSSGTVALTAGNDININNTVTVTGANAKLTMTYGGNYNIRTPASYSGVAPVLKPVFAPVASSYGTKVGYGTKAGMVLAQVYDKDGKPVYELGDGLIYDGEGNPVYETVLDQNGHPVQGNQVTGPVAAKDTSGGIYGSISFTNSNNKNGLVINGATYTLAHSMSDLVAINSATPDINGYASGNGNYALAGNLYATSDGTASGTPTSYNNAIIARLGGTLAGLGNTINSLTIDASTANNIGLIGQITAPNVVIRDIGLIGAQITGKDWVGALLGNYTSTGLTISQAYSTGAIVGANFVGGLVGSAGTEPADVINAKPTALSTIHDSFSTASVSGGGQVGGLIGNASGATVFRTDATGNVAGNTGVGGLIGRMTFTTVDTSYATGEVKGVLMDFSPSTSIGGLIGYVRQFPRPGAKSSVSNSFATGAVSGEQIIGGLIGRVAGLTSAGPEVMTGYEQFWMTVTNSYATGNVTSNDASNVNGVDLNPGVGRAGLLSVGGLIGAANNVNLAKTFATGDVVSNAITSFAAGGIGGLVGTMRGTTSSTGSITDSFATGDVRGAILVDATGTVLNVGQKVGGLVGEGNTATISHSYATGAIVGNTRVGGLVGDGGLIADSFATGNVIGTTQVGGLVGAGLNITRSFATGDVTGISYTNSNGVFIGARQTGGLAGDLFGSNGFGQITDSWASGAVSGFTQSGGLVGRATGSVVITNSWWNGDTGPSNAVGDAPPQTVVNGGGSLTGNQVTDAQFYANGTIDQVLADRASAAAAAQAAAEASAAAQAVAEQGARTASVTASNAQNASSTPPDPALANAGASAAQRAKSAAVENSIKSVDDAVKADDAWSKRERQRRRTAQTSHRGYTGSGGAGGGLGATIRSIDVNGQRFNLENSAPKQDAPAQAPH